MSTHFWVKYIKEAKISFSAGQMFTNIISQSKLKTMTGWDMNVLDNWFVILLSGDNPI